MFERCKIMRAVADGLNSIDVEIPSQVTEPVVKAKLCEIGRGFRFYTCANTVEGADCNEWLFDVTWLKYDCDESF